MHSLLAEQQGGDRALMQAFGQSGVGVFMAPTVIDSEIAEQHRVEAIGSTSEVRERYYAISTERRLRHAGVVAVSQAARLELFGGADEPPSTKG